MTHYGAPRHQSCTGILRAVYTFIVYKEVNCQDSQAIDPLTWQYEAYVVAEDDLGEGGE
jgi:hypothetical protein